MPHIILLGTLDSKLEEFRFLYDELYRSTSHSAERSVRITLIDCGRRSVEDPRITISRDRLLREYGGPQTTDVESLPRSDLIKHMTQCAIRAIKSLVAEGRVNGILSAGGSGGTTLAASVMRDAAPIGLPKLIVSTVASGDTGPLVGETDITMMYSVVDIAGSNELLRTVLGNAAAAMIGMATADETRKLGETKATSKHKVGITMFGVTTPSVDHIRTLLEKQGDTEVYVFHATGHGGKAMERLVVEGQLDAVIDLTTTEICDHLMGGNMSAGGERMEAPLKAGIPYVVSLGATDMVNFGAKATVPEKYADRKLYEHNPTVTLMRTSVAECMLIADFFVEKLRNHARNPANIKVFIPHGGVSMIAKPDGPFADPSADQALVHRLKEGLEGTSIGIIEKDEDINDPKFAQAVANTMLDLLKSDYRKKPQ